MTRRLNPILTLTPSLLCVLAACSSPREPPERLLTDPLVGAPRPEVMIGIAAPRGTRVSLTISIQNLPVCEIRGQIEQGEALELDAESLIVVKGLCLLKHSALGTQGFDAPMRVEGFLIPPGGPRVPLTLDETVGGDCLLVEPDCIAPIVVLGSEDEPHIDCQCCCRCDHDKA